MKTYMCLICGYIYSEAEGDVEAAHALWVKVADVVQRHEDDIHPALDVFEFVETLGRQFRIRSD